MFKRIVVGTDGSETAAEAVRQAIELGSVPNNVSHNAPCSVYIVRTT